jgi:hypothetical protein
LVGGAAVSWRCGPNALGETHRLHPPTISLLQAASSHDQRLHVADARPPLCTCASAASSLAGMCLHCSSQHHCFLQVRAVRSCKRSQPASAGDPCLLLTRASLAHGLMQRHHSGAAPSAAPAPGIAATGPARQTSLSCSLSIFARGEQVCAALEAGKRTCVGGVRACLGVFAHVSVLSIDVHW